MNLMETPFNSISGVGMSYALFFLGSFAFLLLIVLAGVPEMWRSFRKQVRLAVARRRRVGRMLADLDQLDTDALLLEGDYVFESEEEEATQSAGEVDWAELYDGLEVKGRHSEAA